MQSTTEETDTKTTDPRGEGKAPKGGQTSRNKRQANYRQNKNKETDAAIMNGIFARLKITDPTAVPALPLARDLHPVTVPVAFKAAPEFVDRVWDTMEAVGTRPFGMLNTHENKNIFKKGMLILSEAKVCYAQRAHLDKPDEELPSKKMYTLEELQDLNNMASMLPYPLAIYLESIGNCVVGKQIVTPLIAELQDYAAGTSGAITYAPRQLLPLLRLLHAGVPLNGELHQVAISLMQLPAISWEDIELPFYPPAIRGAPGVRITRVCFDFWTTGDPGQERIKWTDFEYRIFTKIVQSLSSKKGFNIATDLSPGNGSLSQIVQVPQWSVGHTCEWFTMDDTTDYDQKLGVAFGFGYFSGQTVQPSRFTGTYTTSYWRGELTPRRVMHAIVAGQE